MQRRNPFILFGSNNHPQQITLNHNQIEDIISRTVESYILNFQSKVQEDINDMQDYCNEQVEDIKSEAIRDIEKIENEQNRKINELDASFIKVLLNIKQEYKSIITHTQTIINDIEEKVTKINGALNTAKNNLNQIIQLFDQINNDEIF